MSADRAPGDFGSRLRAAREKRGVSLRQIANATKISVAALEALERNDISRLPGGIFSRAFVRSYAIEVGLDPEATIQDFIAQFPSDSVTAGHPTSAHAEDHQAHESDRQMASTFVRLIAISLPIAGAVVYFGLANRSVAPQEASPSATVEATTGEPRPHEEPAPPPAAPAPAPAPVPPLQGTAPPPAAPAATTETATPAAPAPSDRLAVGLVVTSPCWITATVDGQRTINRLVQPGERIAVDVQRDIVLAAGDAEAVKLTLNGAAARSLGKSGDVVTVRLTPANFKGYLLNR
jgi:cytoskeletal protein RodZ